MMMLCGDDIPNAVFFFCVTKCGRGFRLRVRSNMLGHLNKQSDGGSVVCIVCIYFY